MNILIITGGIGPEREVSFSSAKYIKELLSISDKFVIDYPYQIDQLNNILSEVDVCIPMIHGKGGEDGDLHLYLEKLNISYIFSSPEVHRKCLDKRKAKETLRPFGINSAKEFSITDDINTSVFIKPISGGSSVYTKKTSLKKELVDFVNDNSDIDFLIEEALVGREFSVGVVESEAGIKPLPVIEIKTKDGFFDYDSKYNHEKLAEEICPANISDELKNLLQEQAIIAHTKMGCRHISRSDFIVNNDNQIYFLEINTIPGMTNSSLIPRALQVEDLSLKELFIFWLNQVK